MKLSRNLKFILSLLLTVLIAVSTFTGCKSDKDDDKDNGKGGKDKNEITAADGSDKTDSSDISDSSDKSQDEKKDNEILFTFEVTGKDKKTETFDITTSKKKLGDALRDEGLITEKGFVNTVNGVTADWNDNESWWKLLEDGEMTSVGVDEVDVKEGAVYAYVFTQGM